MQILRELVSILENIIINQKEELTSQLLFLASSFCRIILRTGQGKF